ncbi:MAG: hypothetical protein ABIE22_01305 [archaeon]
MKNAGLFVGLASIIIGAVFAFNSFSGLTGYVILNNSSSGFSGIIAACFIIGGLLLIVTEKRVVK